LLVQGIANLGQDRVHCVFHAIVTVDFTKA
jgi:hypothetical protein